MTRANHRVLVTGGTGKTGGAIARRLGELGLEVRIASRAAGGAGQVRFDWADVSTHAAALDGVTRAYLVAPALVEDPAGVMVPFIERALASGVQRLVLLGSSAISEGAPGLGEVARVLRATAPEWAVLRPSWFMHNFVDPVHAHGRTVAESGTLVTSTGGGRVGFVDVADIAEVGARALADEQSHDTAHVITGPQALSYAEVASIMTEVLGRPVRHVDVDDEQSCRRLVASGMPERYARLLVDLDVAIRGGAEDRVTDTVERVTGRPPRSFGDFLRAHVAAS